GRQHRHLLDAARPLGIPARPADPVDGRVRLQRAAAGRAREHRLPGPGRTCPLRARTLSGVRLRDRTGIQEVLHGRVERAPLSRRASGDAWLHPPCRQAGPQPAGRCGLSDDVPVQQPPSPDLGGEHAYRRRLPDGGRVHIDRPLPFLLLARHPDEPFSLARRVASISAASVVWPQAGGEAAEAGAAAEVTALLDQLGEAYPNFLLIVLHDLPRDLSLHEESPRLEPFQFLLAASGDRAAQDVAATLESALSQLEIDLRVPELRTVPLPPLSPALAAAVDGREGISVLSLGIPQIHRIPGDPRRIYPQIYHQVESAIYDALLQAAAHFVELAEPEVYVHTRRHHRSLGRRRFVKAAKRADDALASISASFDFLLGVSPINTEQAYAGFEACQRRKQPEFRYRPLPINPDLVKRRLYAIDLRAVEDPVL